ncbi:MAG: CheR family methyltransferase, partial [Planctomycetota bacterium]
MDGNSNSQSSVGRDTNSAEEDGLIVVGIGTSAGGVEALETLFSRMPENTGMAFVVVQHLPSEFDTLMPQILSRKTSMPVYSIEDGITLAPNRVFVLPNGMDVSVSGNQLITKEHSTGREDLPIDYFLRSLADEFEENAIAVVLSGTGTDGTNGAQAIHSRHGMVIAQSVSSAKFNGMPRSVIASGTADVIESVEQIPETLMKYSELAKLGDSTSRARRFQNSLDSESQIRQLISKNYGIDFDHYKPGLFDRRLARRIEISKIESVSDYSEILKNDELELFGLYNDLLIGVTEFFRDSEAFAELQYRALPDLLGNAPNDDSDFRVWIAPCATGEEAYSIAILLDELIQQRGYQRSVKIFATDINQRCVQTAANGFYPSDRLENLSEERIKKYFVETDGGYTICPRIRQQVVFAKHDVLNDAPFTKLDLVCCRNLLIYFQSAAKKKALSLFNFSLKNAGILFLGPSEGTTELNSAFSTVNEKWRIYRKLNPLRFSEVAGPINLGQRHVPVLMQNKRMDSNLEKRSFEIYDELLKQYMPPGLLINEHHEIEHIFGDASKFLRYDHGRPTKNLIDLLPNSFGVVVRNGLKRVKLDKKHVFYPGVDHTSSQGAQTYRICVKPVTTKIAPRFLVTIEEDQQLSDLNPLHSIRQNSEGCSEDMLGLLEEELRETRESLNDSILNLKSANEEMQTTNEELIASNEELQSTNEELHSVNEELYTVNAEHQRKIGELTELTSDMDNLLDSIQVDTIYLDRDLRVRKFTLGIANNFKLLPQDLGRQFSSFNHNLKIRNLAECVHSVIETETLFEKEVQDKRGNWYLMRILPYSSRDSISGVLITLVGINNLKQTQEKLKELSEIVSCSGDAIFRVTLEGKILTWNAGAEEIFGLKQTEAIGCNICNLLPDQN